jgi:tetratricopeptide (TPR) repeat protein
VLSAPQAHAQDDVLLDPLDVRVAECTSAMDGECLLEVADFAAAAKAFERFARDRADNPRAPRSLEQAVRLYRELGQPALALAAARDFRRLFPQHQKVAEVAEEVFLLGDLYRERGDDTREAEHYENYLEEWSRHGGKDRAVVAHVRLAESLLERSCPVAGVRGACIEVRRVPFKCAEDGVPDAIKAKQPTHLTNEEVIRHRRNPALVKAAEQHLKTAKRMAPVVKAQGFGSFAENAQARRNDLADAVADSMLLAVHAARDEFLSLRAPPAGLRSFEPPLPSDSDAVAARKAWEFEDSQRRWLDWVETKTHLFKRLRETTHKAKEELGPRSIIRAAGLFAEATADLSVALTDDQNHIRECRPDAAVDSAGWVLEANAETALAHCVFLASITAGEDEWVRICQPRDLAGRHSVRWWLIRPPFFGEQHELLPALHPVDEDNQAAAPPTKPLQDPASEMHSNRFAPRPFPGLRKSDPGRRLAVLKMSEGQEIAWIFKRLLPFDGSIVDRLVAEAGASSLPNPTTFLGWVLLDVQRDCYRLPPPTLLVETSGNHITSIDSPQARARTGCLEKAREALVLPRTIFKQDHARWRIDF